MKGSKREKKKWRALVSKYDCFCPACTGTAREDRKGTRTARKRLAFKHEEASY